MHGAHICDTSVHTAACGRQVWLQQRSFVPVYLKYTLYWWILCANVPAWSSLAVKCGVNCSCRAELCGLSSLVFKPKLQRQRMNEAETSVWPLYSSQLQLTQSECIGLGQLVNLVGHSCQWWTEFTAKIVQFFRTDWTFKRPNIRRVSYTFKVSDW